MENDKEHSVTDIDEARASLAAIRTSNQRLAQRMRWPFWRHLLSGLSCGALLVGQTLGSTGSILISLGVIIAALHVVNSDKRRYGMFVSGFSGRQARWVALGLGALAVAGVFYVRTGVAEPQREQPVFWVLLAAMVAGATAASYLWQYIYQREVRGDL